MSQGAFQKQPTHQTGPRPTRPHGQLQRAGLAPWWACQGPGMVSTAARAGGAGDRSLCPRVPALAAPTVVE